MVKSTCEYLGQLHCDLEHEPSGSLISTDAPKDNNGKGESFSPTDLVGAALTSCILTTIGIVANRDGIKFDGARAEVEKEMTDNPRKIKSLAVKLFLPASLTPEQRKKYERVAEQCPVHQSLHPDVKIPLTFIYQ